MEACALQVQLVTYAVHIAASLRIHAVMSSLIFLGFSFFFKVDDVDGLRLFFFCIKTPILINVRRCCGSMFTRLIVPLSFNLSFHCFRLRY